MIITYNNQIIQPKIQYNIKISIETKNNKFIYIL